MKQPLILFVIISLISSCNTSRVSATNNKNVNIESSEESSLGDQIQFNQNKVIAHRGAWKNTGTPQNSIASLKAAIDMGCAGSEMDVHMTGDSMLVVNHDADYAGLKVQESALTELRKTPLTNGEPFPLLEDFLAIIKTQKGTRLILEIKPSQKGREWANATVQRVVTMVQEMKAQPWVVYISFDFEMCKEILRLQPTANVQYLNGDKTPAQLKDENISGMDYHYSIFSKHPEWIAEAKELKIDLNAWTVNDAGMMKQLLAAGFNYITTNEPEMLFQITSSEKR